MSAVLSDLRGSSPWRSASVAIAGVVLLILLLYRDTAMAMASIWFRSDTFAHGVLVPFISLWLIWRQRQQLARLSPRPHPWALGFMVLVAAAWFLADLAIVNAASQFALVALLILAVPAVLGLQVARTILFPLLFLLFAVPFGEFMLPPMMDWTADFTVAALRATGVPVFREGLHFVIPTGRWSVIDECSGVRYLIASFMVGSLFAYLNYQSYWRRTAFMAFSIVVPIVANWLRAYMIVMMGHLSNNRIAVGVDHILYGWVFFGIVIFIMFLIGSRWSEPERNASSVNATGGGTGAAAVTWAPTAALLGAAAAAAVIVSLPHSARWALQRSSAGAVPATFTLPPSLASGWEDRGDKIAEWAPRFTSPSASTLKVFKRDGDAVGLFVAYYRGQGGDRKLISSQNGLVGLNDTEWFIASRGRREFSGLEASVVFRTAEVRSRAVGSHAKPVKLTTWSVYWIDGAFVTGDLAAKLVGAAAQIRGRGDDGAAIVFFADANSPDGGQAAIEAFAKDNLASLDSLLQRARDAR